MKKPKKKRADQPLSLSESAANSDSGDGAAQTKKWELRLYVAGQAPRSALAFSNLKRLCDQHLPGRYTIEVVDLLKHPQLAAGDQIVAIPTLVRKLPQPIRKIIGDLRDTERTLVGLDIRPPAS